MTSDGERRARRPLPCPEPPPMLDDMEKTISMSQLTKHAERIALDIERSKTVYRVRRPGGNGLLLMDEEYYQGWMMTIELMQQPNWREEWDQATRDFAQGIARPLEEVVEEIRRDRLAKSSSRRPASRASGRRRTKGPSRSAQPRRRST
jgi:PHD/YefM family antitoxin component YafN of YafNO toxin-antitoxin module